VEGAELQVLAGAGSVLSEVRPDAIICEMGGFAGGSQPSYVLRRLLAAGYAPHEITLAGLAPLARDPEAINVETWEQRNICFLRQDGKTVPVAGDQAATVRGAATETLAAQRNLRT
jgi:hypothetical protein